MPQTQDTSWKDLGITVSEEAEKYLSMSRINLAMHFPNDTVVFALPTERFMGMKNIIYAKYSYVYEEGITLQNNKITTVGIYEKKDSETSIAWFVIFGMISVCSMVIFNFSKKTAFAALALALAADDYKKTSNLFSIVYYILMCLYFVIIYTT